MARDQASGVLDLVESGFLGSVQGGEETVPQGRAGRPGLALTGPGLPFSPAEDVVLHSESSSLSESGASHDNGKDPSPPNPPLH